MLCGVLSFAATRGTRIEPTPAALPPPTVAIEPDPGIEVHPLDPAWTLTAAPFSRIGFRLGRAQLVEVVRLGPAAIEVEVNTARAFLAMRAAAADAGIDLRIASGFRTVRQQRALFHRWQHGNGHEAARPGRSNHQSGRALDLTVFSSPGTLAWLDANAGAFGFKRTVKGEPWHWEYVEIPVARGAPKRISRVKLAKLAKRPARRPGSHAGARVASSQR